MIFGLGASIASFVFFFVIGYLSKYLSINWPLDSLNIKNPILSEKDLKASVFSEVEHYLEIEI